MTAAEGSILGIAKQVAEGTPNTTDAEFKYLLYREGSVAPNNVILPLDPEVGGGALLRNVVKVAVNSGGGLSIIPRPETLGMFLMGVTGKCESSDNYRDDAVLAAHDLDGSTVNQAGLGQPTLATKVSAKATGAATGNLVISGTVDGSADTETLVLDGTTRVVSTKEFSAITSIVLPTAAGVKVDIGWPDGSRSHVFTLDPDDMFSAPFYTVRSQLAPAKANAWAEQFQDVRVNMVAMEWRAPGFVGGTVAMVGGEATGVSDPADWNHLQYLDSGPQFLTSVGSKIKIYGAQGGSELQDLSVLGGSFAAGSAIPLDEQFVVGSYFPEGLEIVNRSFGVNLVVKIPDEKLYKMMMYNPGSANAWAAEIMREARMALEFKSDQDAATVKKVGDVSDARPYSIKIDGNNLGGDQANVAWAMAPISTRAQRQVVAQLSGTFMASPDGASAPITITLVNRKAGTY